MKNIFIGGVAKSGKSRLAVSLCKKHGLNHIPLDYFTSSFKHTFPEIGITSNVLIDEKSSKLLGSFLKRFIEIVELKDDEFFIIDSAHIFPDDIIRYLDRDKWDIYYLGYPNTTTENKLTEVKKYADGGWILNKSQDELLEIFNQLIKLSNNIEKKCKENNIKFIDTSNNDILDLF